MFSVPTSQLSGAYFYDDTHEISEEERKKILEYIPNMEQFNPRNADFVKWQFNQELYNNNPGNFWKLYIDIFKKKPVTFLSIFLDLNINYWYIGAPLVDEYSYNVYIPVGVYILEEYPIVQEDILPQVRAYYERIAAAENSFMQLPLVRQYFSISFPFVILYFCAYCLLRGRRGGRSIFYVIFMLLFLTYMLGPVSIYRYMYTFYLAMPLFIGLLYCTPPKERSEKRL